ncbi:hypothetical protein [Idiomarina sp.]|uniref:hypothetical protein n=1 Tax=Idiomarina sp. TaxID=1874361 RepID=UPI003A920045
MEQTEKVRKSNFVVRLFKGDVSLPITYWIFGVLIGGIGSRLALSEIESNFSQLSISDNGMLLIYTIIGSFGAYSLFMLVAIWRSANKYDGSAIWSYLAKFAVILNLVLFGVNLWKANDTEYTLKEGLRMVNASLPAMIDKETRLNSMSIEGKSIISRYTMVNWSVEKVKVEEFKSFMREKLTTKVCERDDTRSLLEEGYRTIHAFFDKNSNDITKITLNIDDCSEE